MTFVQSWANVEDVGPALYKWYTNASRLLGYDPQISGRSISVSSRHSSGEGQGEGCLAIGRSPADLNVA